MLVRMKFWQIRRKIHTSWLIAVCSVGIVIGVALVPNIGQSTFSSYVWLTLGTALAIIVLWRRYIYLVPIILIAGLLVGFWRGSIVQAQLFVYEGLINRTVTLRGHVSDDPDVGKSNEALLRLSDIMVNGKNVAGKIWASTLRPVDQIKRGDIVTLSGKLREGFGSFAASLSGAEIIEIKRPEPGDVAVRVRDWFGGHVRQGINEPEVSLGLGYLLGQRRALPPELDQALIVTGLTHVVVASGYNLTILVRFARRLFVRVSKYLAVLSATAMVVSFMAITGASPSMTRAGLVSGMSLAAWYYGRKFHPLVLLPLAAAITVLVDPTYAWNDLGWQLSFAAFAGVMVLAPLLQRYFFGDKKPGNIRQIAGETISAQIVTMPILILAFGQFSNVAIIANLMVLIFVPLAMVLTFIAGIGAIIIPSLAWLFGLPAQLLLQYMTAVIEYFAGLPWALSVVEINPWMVWLSYAAIIAICIYLQRVTRYNLRDSNLVE